MITKPKRSDDKYWTGTRNFNHIQYESDLEDYIIDLESELYELRKTDSTGSYIVFENENDGLSQLSIDLPTLERARIYANEWKTKTLYIYKYVENT